MQICTSRKKITPFNILHEQGECEVQYNTERNLEKHLDLVECRHDLQAVKHKLPLNLLPLRALLS